MASSASSSRTYGAASPAGISGQSGSINDDALWGAFASARTAADFCNSWLALQCLQVSEVRAALLLLEQGGGTFVPAAVWPPQQLSLIHI